MSKNKLSNLTLNQAKYLYANEPDMQNDLLKVFDLKDLKPFDYADIKSFEDACEKLGIDPIGLIENYDSINTPEWIKATHKLGIIFEAINNGWEPDWDNTNEDKYYSWFNMSSASFDDSYCVSWSSISDAGSRLCTYSREVSDYIGKQFEDIYLEAFLIK